MIMSKKMPEALMKIGLFESFLAGSGENLYDYRLSPTPSFTAGTNKYAKHVSNEDALNEDEKRRNAEIDAKKAAKKAARKGGM